MEDQFELFTAPPTRETGKVPPLSMQAIAYVVELEGMLDRAKYPRRGRVDYIRSSLRLSCDCPFSNARGLSREITKILKGYEAFPSHIRDEVEKLRPAVKRAMIKNGRRLFS